MENILSQEEVDALIQGISSGEVPIEEDTSGDDIEARPYDLTRQDRIIVGRIPAVEILKDRFCRKVRGTFTSALRRVVEITSISSEVKKFGEFLKILPVPTSIHIFRVEPLRGTALLVLESGLVFSLIELMMGGSGDGRVKVEGRDFTNIESRLIGRLVREALKDLETSWQSLEPVSLTLERSEINPQFATVMPETELTICLHMEMEVESAAGTFVLCLPYTMMDSYRNRLLGKDEKWPEAGGRWEKQLVEHLWETEVTLSVELGECRSTLREVLNLKVGDILFLEEGPPGPVRILVEGVLKFLGQPGRCNGKNAVKIIDGHSERRWRMSA